MIERINSAFDVPALEAEFKAFKEGCNESQQAIVQLYSTVKSYKGANLGTITGKTTELDAATKKLIGTTDKLNRSMITFERAQQASIKTGREQIRNETELEKKQQASNRTKETAARLEATLAASKAKLAKIYEQEKAALDKTTNAYEILKKQYMDASNLSKARGAELLQIANGNEKVYRSLLGQDEVYQAATDAAQRYYKQLDLLEVEVGQHQRRVGQYERANWGLNNSINQLTRELPAFANSFQTGFMAISNNLPTFIDEIGKLKKENKELAASGEKPKSVMGQLAGSLFSLQTAFSIGITLLTVYGAKLAEWVIGMFDADEAAEKQRKSIVELNKAFVDAKKANEEFWDSVSTKIDEQTLPKQVEIINAEGRARSEQLAAEKKVEEQKALLAQERYSRMLQEGKNISELFAKYQIAEERFEKIIANPRDYGGADSDTFKSQKESAESARDVAKTAYQEIAKAQDEYYDTFFANANKQREIETYNAELSRKEALETAKIRAKAVIDSNTAILNDERSTEAKRIAAIKAIAAANKAAAAAELQAIKTDPASEKEDKRIAAKQFAEEEKRINRDAEKEIYDTKLEFANRARAALKAINDTRRNDERQIQEGIVEQEQTAAEQRIYAANEVERMQREAAIADYEHQKTMLDQKAAADNEYEQLEAEKQSNLAEITAEGQRRILGILKSVFEQQQDAQERSLAAIALDGKQLAVNLATDYAKDVDTFTQQLKRKEISYETYKRRIERLDAEFAIKQTKTEVLQLEEVLKTYDDLEVKVAEVRAKIAETEEQYNKEQDKARKNSLYNLLELYKKDLEAYLKTVAAKAEASKKLQELLAELQKLQNDLAETTDIPKWLEKLADKEKEFSAITEAVGNLISAFQDLSQITFDRQAVALEEMAAKQEKAYEDEVKRINALNISDAQRADLLTSLQVRRDAERQEQERKERQLANKKAQSDKQFAIANIILSTTEGVIKALARVDLYPLNIALAAAIGAAGAAQLARAIAAPVPKYERGTESAKGGLALTDEKGAELYIEPGGNTFMGSDSGPVLRHVKAGTKIVPADKVDEYLYRQMMVATARQIQQAEQADGSRAADEIKSAIEQQTAMMIKEMRKKAKGTTINNNIDIGGWGKYVQQKTFN